MESRGLTCWSRRWILGIHDQIGLFLPNWFSLGNDGGGRKGMKPGAAATQSHFVIYCFKRK